MLTLHDYPLSGNCYKVRLLLALLDVPHERVPVDFHPGRQHRSPEWLALNPRGTLPILVDGDQVLCDSGAILVYVAARHDGTGQWFPTADAGAMADCIQWLAHADTLTATASAARLHDMLGYPLDVEAARAGARRAFRLLDEHLLAREIEGGEWLVGDGPTVADVACFPYSALAGDGGIDTGVYHALTRWMTRIRGLPGFVTMPGIHPIFADTGLVT